LSVFRTGSSPPDAGLIMTKMEFPILPPNF
jgi:hypothetical protein